jgi:hypothetical protein
MLEPLTLRAAVERAFGPDALSRIHMDEAFVSSGQLDKQVRPFTLLTSRDPGPGHARTFVMCGSGDVIATAPTVSTSTKLTFYLTLDASEGRAWHWRREQVRRGELPFDPAVDHLACPSPRLALVASI